MATLLYNNHAALCDRRARSAPCSARCCATHPTPPAQPATSFVPAADILESAQGFELHLALPGVKKEAVKIEFLDGQLIVSGERPNPNAAAKEAASSATEAGDEVAGKDNKPW